MAQKLKTIFLTFLSLTVFVVASGSANAEECSGLRGYIAMAFSSDSEHLAAGGQGGGGCFEIWRIPENKTSLIMRRNQSVNSVAYSSDGRFLYIGKFKGEVSIMDTTTNEVITDLKGYSSNIALAVSNDGRFLATGGSSAISRLTDLETKSVVLEMDSHAIIRSLDFSPNGHYLAIAETYGVDLWDVKKGILIKEFNDGNNAFSVKFSPDGKRLVAATSCTSRCGKNIKTIDLVDLKLSELSGGPASKITFTSDGKYLVVGKANGDVILIDETTNSVSEIIGNVGAYVSSIAVSRNNKYLAVGAMNGSLNVWDIEKKQLIISHN